jgi:hypothetical protein
MALRSPATNEQVVDWGLNSSQAMGPCHQQQPTPRPWPCPVCLPAEEIVDFLDVGGVIARCRAPDGRETLRFNHGPRYAPPETVCPALQTLAEVKDTLPTRALDGALAFATRHGNVTNGMGQHLFMPGAQPLTRAEGRLWTAGWAEQPGVGMRPATGEPDASSVVESDLGELSAAARSSDGGEWMLTTGGAARSDSIFAGPSSDAGLTFRVSPRPFSPIVSLAALPPAARSDGGTPFISGYAIAGEALFYFEATTESRWRVREVAAPPSAYVSVWVDGSAGRLAASDGVLRSLPSLVQLSGAVPGGGVTQLRRVCGQPYASGANGVFRLERATDGGLASWRDVGLSAVLPGFDPDRGLPARLDLLGSDLFVTNAYGAVARLGVPLTCD